MKKEELYLNLLNDGSLDLLREELEKAIISNDGYISAIKAYFKKIDRNPEINDNRKDELKGYHLINNNKYICDTFSFFKVTNTKKLEKVISKEINICTEAMKDSIELDIERENLQVYDVDLFDITFEKGKRQDKTLYKIGECWIDEYYFKTIGKLLNVKKIKMCNDKNKGTGFTFCLDENNNVIAGILPCRM